MSVAAERARHSRRERLPPLNRTAGEGENHRRESGSEAAIDSWSEPDLLRPGEECESSPGHELPGATLPWALTRILHSRPKNGNTGRRPAAAADRGARQGLGIVC